MLKRILAIAILALAAHSVSAADIFIASSSAGAANGSNCANAFAWTEWTVAGAWTAGNILHVCGTRTQTTNTTGIQAIGSGTSGNPITIKFEAGSILQSAAFAPAGAIDLNGQSFITIDGGGNATGTTIGAGTGGGTIQNTADGDALANQISSIGVNNNAGGFSNNIIIKNLVITNLYIKVQGTNDGATSCGPLGTVVCPNDDSACINNFGGNSLITHISFDHCASGISSGNSSHHEISFNLATFSQHAVSDGSSNTNVIDIKIHDNDLGGGAYLWDNTAHNYHHNGIIIIDEQGIMGNCDTTDVYIYNNFIHGTWSLAAGGGLTTAGIFIDDYPTTLNGQSCNGREMNNRIIFDAADVGVANAGMMAGYGGFIVANNAVSVLGPGYIEYKNVTGNVAYNNIGTGFPTTQGNANCETEKGAAPNVATIDYSLCYVIGGNAFFNPDQGGFFNFSAWQGLGYDIHSLVSIGSPSTDNPLLTSTGLLSTSSAAIGVGKNLTSLGIAELNTDACGNLRPASAAWDMGACQFAASGGVPTAPTGALPLTFNIVVPVVIPPIKITAPTLPATISQGTQYSFAIGATGCGAAGTSACSCSMPIIPKGFTISFAKTTGGCTMAMLIAPGTYTISQTVNVSVSVQ